MVALDWKRKHVPQVRPVQMVIAALVNLDKSNVMVFKYRFVRTIVLDGALHKTVLRVDSAKTTNVVHALVFLEPSAAMVQTRHKYVKPIALAGKLPRLAVRQRCVVVEIVSSVLVSPVKPNATETKSKPVKRIARDGLPQKLAKVTKDVAVVSVSLVCASPEQDNVMVRA